MSTVFLASMYNVVFADSISMFVGLDVLMFLGRDFIRLVLSHYLSILCFVVYIFPITSVLLIVIYEMFLSL